MLSLAAGIAATSLGLVLGRGVAAWRTKRAQAVAALGPLASLGTTEPAEIGGRP